MAAWDKTIRLAGEKPKLKNIKVGYSTDNDLNDAGDDLVYDSDFSTSSTTVSHDDNGRLAVEGVFIYRYGDWNPHQCQRMAKHVAWAKKTEAYVMGMT